MATMYAALAPMEPITESTGRLAALQGFKAETIRSASVGEPPGESISSTSSVTRSARQACSISEITESADAWPAPPMPPLMEIMATASRAGAAFMPQRRRALFRLTRTASRSTVPKAVHLTAFQ